MTWILCRTWVWSIVVNNISLAILIEEERWVDALEIEFVRIAPALEWVLCLNDDVTETTRELGGNHVECLVVLVIDNLRSIDTCRNAAVMQFKLGHTVENMANLLPVHHIC